MVIEDSNALQKGTGVSTKRALKSIANPHGKNIWQGKCIAQYIKLILLILRELGKRESLDVPLVEKNFEVDTPLSEKYLKVEENYMI